MVQHTPPVALQLSEAAGSTAAVRVRLPGGSTATARPVRKRTDKVQWCELTASGGGACVGSMLCTFTTSASPSSPRRARHTAAMPSSGGQGCDDTRPRLAWHSLPSWTKGVLSPLPQEGEVARARLRHRLVDYAALVTDTPGAVALLHTRSGAALHQRREEGNPAVLWRWPPPAEEGAADGGLPPSAAPGSFSDTESDSTSTSTSSRHGMTSDGSVGPGAADSAGGGGRCPSQLLVRGGHADTPFPEALHLFAFGDGGGHAPPGTLHTFALHAEVPHSHTISHGVAIELPRASSCARDPAALRRAGLHLAALPRLRFVLITRRGCVGELATLLQDALVCDLRRRAAGLPPLWIVPSATVSKHSRAWRRGGGRPLPLAHRCNSDAGPTLTSPAGVQGHVPEAFPTAESGPSSPRRQRMRSPVRANGGEGLSQHRRGHDQGGSGGIQVKVGAGGRVMFVAEASAVEEGGSTPPLEPPGAPPTLPPAPAATAHAPPQAPFRGASASAAGLEAGAELADFTTPRYTDGPVGGLWGGADLAHAAPPSPPDHTPPALLLTPAAASGHWVQWLATVPPTPPGAVPTRLHLPTPSALQRFACAGQGLPPLSPADFVAVQLPGDGVLPLPALGHRAALAALAPDVLLRAVELLAQEAQVLVVGASAAQVVAVCEALPTLLAPLHWTGSHIPLLPTTFMDDLLQAPIAFLYGVTAAALRRALAPVPAALSSHRRAGRDVNLARLVDCPGAVAFMVGAEGPRLLPVAGVSMGEMFAEAACPGRVRRRHLHSKRHPPMSPAGIAARTVQSMQSGEGVAGGGGGEDVQARDRALSLDTFDALSSTVSSSHGGLGTDASTCHAHVLDLDAGGFVQGGLRGWALHQAATGRWAPPLPAECECQWTVRMTKRVAAPRAPPPRDLPQRRRPPRHPVPEGQVHVVPAAAGAGAHGADGSAREEQDSSALSEQFLPHCVALRSTLLKAPELASSPPVLAGAAAELAPLHAAASHAAGAWGPQHDLAVAGIMLRFMWHLLRGISDVAWVPGGTRVSSTRFAILKRKELQLAQETEHICIQQLPFMSSRRLRRAQAFFRAFAGSQAVGSFLERHSAVHSSTLWEGLLRLTADTSDASAEQVGGAWRAPRLAIPPPRPAEGSTGSLWTPARQQDSGAFGEDAPFSSSASPADVSMPLQDGHFTVDLNGWVTAAGVVAGRTPRAVPYATLDFTLGHVQVLGHRSSMQRSARMSLPGPGAAPPRRRTPTTCPSFDWSASAGVWPAPDTTGPGFLGSMGSLGTVHFLPLAWDVFPLPPLWGGGYRGALRDVPGQAGFLAEAPAVTAAAWAAHAATSLRVAQGTSTHGVLLRPPSAGGDPPSTPLHLQAHSRLAQGTSWRHAAWAALASCGDLASCLARGQPTHGLVWRGACHLWPPPPGATSGIHAMAQAAEAAAGGGHGLLSLPHGPGRDGAAQLELPMAGVGQAPRLPWPSAGRLLGRPWETEAPVAVTAGWGELRLPCTEASPCGEAALQRLQNFHEALPVLAMSRHVVSRHPAVRSLVALMAALLAPTKDDLQAQGQADAAAPAMADVVAALARGGGVPTPVPGGPGVSTHDLSSDVSGLPLSVRLRMVSRARAAHAAVAASTPLLVELRESGAALGPLHPGLHAGLGKVLQGFADATWRVAFVQMLQQHVLVLRGHSRSTAVGIVAGAEPGSAAAAIAADPRVSAHEAPALDMGAGEPSASLLPQLGLGVFRARAEHLTPLTMWGPGAAAITLAARVLVTACVLEGDFDTAAAMMQVADHLHVHFDPAWLGALQSSALAAGALPPATPTEGERALGSMADKASPGDAIAALAAVATRQLSTLPWPVLLSHTCPPWQAVLASAGAWRGEEGGGSAADHAADPLQHPPRPLRFTLSAHLPSLAHGVSLQRLLVLEATAAGHSDPFWDAVMRSTFAPHMRRVGLTTPPATPESPTAPGLEGLFLEQLHPLVAAGAPPRVLSQWAAALPLPKDSVVALSAAVASVTQGEARSHQAAVAPPSAESSPGRPRSSSAGVAHDEAEGGPTPRRRASSALPAPVGFSVTRPAGALHSSHTGVSVAGAASGSPEAVDMAAVLQRSPVRQDPLAGRHTAFPATPWAHLPPAPDADLRSPVLRRPHWLGLRSVLDALGRLHPPSAAEGAVTPHTPGRAYGTLLRGFSPAKADPGSQAVTPGSPPPPPRQWVLPDTPWMPSGPIAPQDLQLLCHSVSLAQQGTAITCVDILSAGAASLPRLPRDALPEQAAGMTEVVLAGTSTGACVLWDAVTGQTLQEAWSAHTGTVVGGRLLRLAGEGAALPSALLCVTAGRAGSVAVSLLPHAPREHTFARSASGEGDGAGRGGGAPTTPIPVVDVGAAPPTSQLTCAQLPPTHPLTPPGQDASSAVSLRTRLGRMFGVRAGGVGTPPSATPGGDSTPPPGILCMDAAWLDATGALLSTHGPGAPQALAQPRACLLAAAGLTSGEVALWTVTVRRSDGGEGEGSHSPRRRSSLRLWRGKEASTPPPFHIRAPAPLLCSGGHAEDSSVQGVALATLQVGTAPVVLSWDRAGVVCAWCSATGGLQQMWRAHSRAIITGHVLGNPYSDGCLLVTGGLDGVANVWALSALGTAAPRAPGAVPPAEGINVHHAASLACGAPVWAATAGTLPALNRVVVAVGTEAGRVLTWAFRCVSPATTILGSWASTVAHQAAVLCCHLHAPSGLLVTGSQDAAVMLHNVAPALGASGEPAATAPTVHWSLPSDSGEPAPGRVQCSGEPVWSTHDSEGAAEEGEGVSGATLALRRSKACHLAQVSSVHLVPGGVVSASWDGSVKAWHALTTDAAGALAAREAARLRAAPGTSEG